MSVCHDRHVHLAVLSFACSSLLLLGGPLFAQTPITELQLLISADAAAGDFFGISVSVFSPGGTPPPAPFPGCDADPTDDDLTCLELPACP